MLINFSIIAVVCCMYKGDYSIPRILVIMCGIIHVLKLNKVEQYNYVNHAVSVKF